MKFYENITQLIGNTPLVKIQKLTNANIFAKLEYFNPANSVKDRPALYMLQQAKENGLINSDTVIIEPTSGNTGIGLALCCAVMNLKLILTMPENMSDERKKMLKGYGAQLVLTPKELGMQGAVDKAFELKKEYSNSYIPMQFENPNNPKIHELTTAKEIWEDLDGNVDILVATIGTGGTLCGTARGLKGFNKDIKIIGVEPTESPLITQGKSGLHGIQGIGANFIPKNYVCDVVDEVVTVDTKSAIICAKQLAQQEGMLVGISSGAAMQAALNISQKDEYQNKNIVVILADYGERYLSTALFDLF
ncbi:cysteine synthase A [bacterium]|nr:cysteine synthase A [bacterium]